MTLSIPQQTNIIRPHQIIHKSYYCSFSYHDYIDYIPYSFQFGTLFTVNVYECSRCHQRMISKKDLIGHRCVATNPTQNPFVYHPAKTTDCLLDLIAFHNYSYHSIQSPVWQALVDSFNRGYQIPKKDKLESLMHDRAMRIQEDILKNLEGKNVTLLIDGATKEGRKFEGFIWSYRGLFYY